jgi:glutathione S-transferase
MQLTLTYFDLAASRGEECRLALHHAGVPFTDERLKPADFQARKGDTPFGALPVLTAEGHGQIAQSNAILALVGRLHGLHPQDPWEAARHEALMAHVEDMRARLNPIRRIADPAERQKAREDVATGYLQDWARGVERQLGVGPYVAGERLHVADLKLFNAMRPFVKGQIDHIPATVFDAHPRLMRLYRAVEDHPTTVAWYAR